MLKRILNWRWLPPFAYILILAIALISTFYTDRDQFAPVLLCVLLLIGFTIMMMVIGHYRPDLLNAYLGQGTEGAARNEVVTALEQLTLAVENNDRLHTPNDVLRAATHARSVLNQLSPPA